MSATSMNHISSLKYPDRLFIDGAWVAASSNQSLDVIAPATEQKYLSVAAASSADINRAVAAARVAFDKGPWPRMSHAERGRYLMAIAEELDRRKQDVARAWPNEMGILHSMATAYAGGVSGMYKFYASLAGQFAFEEKRRTFSGAKVGLLVREPVGVVGAIIPWNGPIALIGFKVAPALLAGCTVVIKGSPEAPSHALIMAEIAEKVGLPPGVLNVVTADREASEALVRHPGIDKIAFTGSSATGKRIASILGERMARYTLELGGKSAAVVLDDYDVEQAAQSIAANACDMTGQVCASLTRMIVSRSRHDAFVEALSSKLSKVVVGDPFDPTTQMGPLATARQRDIVERYIAKGKEAGFKIATGGRRPSHLSRGFFVEPTVFAGVDNRSAIAQEEIFGPVIVAIAADNDEHAIELANDSPYGLNATVFTNDVERAYSVARRLRSGTVGHNGLRLDFSIAFGGFKQSGVGREGGVEGLMPYLETKTVLLDGLPAHIAAAEASRAKA
ncbi:putative aldehyde dehydrogenase [Steroidobacter agaridevorans]|uniref:Putative aldehyde dehydrogenase n=1 Tax=Steroidobacter agaridevorans TaxID=2695856 RepID=A0A829YFK9_9GAMM|nr:aldehyde dehydrogenase [Steroidobacter agaridevorans]GFE82064.1 putative aldehyde dehydrogenase [Steroidobacter agaridevorans]